MEEKGNLQGEAAARRARERGTRVHFCSGVSARRLQRALAREHRGGESPSSERPGEGSERRDPSAPAGARSPPAWPARGAAGGAPREGPRSHAGCPTKSCRTCRDPAMAVSTRGARGNGRSWGDPPLPRGLCWRGDEGRGERVCAVEGIGGQWLQSCEQEFQRAENGVFLLFSPNSDCQLAALTLHPANPSGRGGSFRGRDRPG